MVPEREAARREVNRYKSDDELIENVVRTARAHSRGYKPSQRWVAVMDTFAVGSTVAHALCRRFGYDPDELVR